MDDIVYCPPNVDCPCYARLVADNEKLRAALALDKPRARWAVAVNGQQLLMAEIERYRKTLRDIVRQCNNPIHTCPAGMDRIIERVEEMAIDALGHKQNE